MYNNFKEETELRYYVQKVLPLVYDDSLSYYELLNKVVKKLNVLIQNNSNIPDFILETIRKYIDNQDINAIIEGTIRDYLLNVKYPPVGLTTAKGDGVTDDTNAIQSCIDYAHSVGGGVVYLPYGKYRVNGLILYDNVSIKGFDRYSTTLILNGGATKSIINANCDNVGIYDIGLNGNSGAQLNELPDIFLNGKNFELSNLLFLDCFSAIQTNSTGHLQIDNIVIKSSINKALVFNSENTQLTNCIIEKISNSKGEKCVIIEGNNGRYKIDNISDTPLLCEVYGNNNLVELYSHNHTELFVDNGDKNIIIDSALSKIYSDITVNGYVNINDKVNITDDTLEVKNNLKFGNILTENKYFDTLKFFDNANNEKEFLINNNDKFKLLSKTVDDFGAIGDGETDDYDAFINMFNEYGAIVLGAKTYFLSKKLDLKGNTSIIGLGEKTSILYWNENSESRGIKVTMDGKSKGYYSTCCTISNLSILNDQNGIGSSAIEVDGTSSINDRYLLKPIINNVHISSFKKPPFANGWEVGIKLHNCNGSTIYACCIVGLNNSNQTLRSGCYGIQIKGDTDVLSNTEFMINNVKISLCGSAIKGDFLEGIMLMNSVIIGCNYGINWVETRLTDHLMVTGCHFNCYVRCILTEYIAQFNIQGNLFYLTSDDEGRYCVEIRKNSYMGCVTGNCFQLIGSGVNGGGLVVASYGVTVTGNTFVLPNNNGIWLTADSHNNTVKSNSYIVVKDKVVNNGKNNKVESQGLNFTLGENLSNRGSIYCYSDGNNVYVNGSILANSEKTSNSTLLTIALNDLKLENRTNIAQPTSNQVTTLNISENGVITIGNKSLTSGDWVNLSLVIPVKI